jgi:hypothetical protein
MTRRAIAPYIQLTDMRDENEVCHLISPFSKPKEEIRE